jgi:hypothetical protein
MLCALACCIGTTTTTADSIATAATIPNITIVEFFILIPGLDYEQRGPPPWLKKSKHWRLKAVENPLALFLAFWLNLIVVSELALACCIGNMTAADSIATAATIPNITIVEFFILILLIYLLVFVL